MFDDAPVHLYDRSDRKRGTRKRFSTDPTLPGKRFDSRKPVYVLTSKDTFSAAENFAYTLQQLGRATIVGEPTRGGNHGAFGKPVTPHLVAYVATISTINAVSKSDWGQGVKPDLAAPAADALDAALAESRKALSGRR
ncbi:S41 family peptidase [uncultured Massilia sp.]|uniref:S41 family peptidase n=1 Tax=uncultured Massilia sp. TaxID=169973 RepID=UPI00258DBE06|nr:S41 family peptidase [uncultured Massilia sp.]